MEREPPPFGPVELISASFAGSNFQGEILPVLEQLKASGTARVIDLLVIRKDESGAIAKLTASDLGMEEAMEYGAWVGGFVGLAQGGEEGFDRGTIAGAAELADGHFFDEEDAFRLSSSVPPGWSVAMLLLEHLWAKPLHAAIDRAGGQVLDTMWVTPDELVRFGLAASLEDGQAD